ncbi:VanZ family protein [Microbacterium sp. nov. GSS16]|uniref:VanZ family protein n=1 Tax=Microbacterium sp. nov. GSS16 TaxID=3019890 RepID=UPI00230582CF|nr:VanZ family protein [Microbacterium sp. nov. GSS16]WCD92891.1 VanZ family protein [Microbacterium sp. nov. GSS16]
MSDASKATGIVFVIARWIAISPATFPPTTSTVFELLVNIVLFVPLGLLTSVGWRCVRPWSMVLLGLAISVTIALVQMLPSRLLMISDVIANALATALGCLIARGSFGAIGGARR